MAIEYTFKEQGYAWYAYKGLTKRYNAFQRELVPEIKIQGNKLIIPEVCENHLEKILNKQSSNKAKFTTRNV